MVQAEFNQILSDPLETTRRLSHEGHKVIGCLDSYVPEEFIHAMQKQAEVDEPEMTEVPLIGQSGDMTFVNDAGEESVETEQMTEEELLRGLEGMPPAESPGSQRNGY